MRLDRLAAAALTLLTLVACQTAGPPSAAPAQTSSPTSAAMPPSGGVVVDSPPAATESVPATLGPSLGTGEGVINFDFGPGTFDFPDPGAGLAELGSYRATLTQTFAGTEQGQAAAWSQTYEMAKTDSGDRSLTVSSTGDSDAAADHLRVERAGVAYRSDTNGCTSADVYEADSLAANWEPARFLSGVTAAEPAGSEDRNGVSADHYTFDQRSFGPLPETQSTGNLWVSPGGGYGVSYQVTTIAAADYFGDGVDGTLTTDYELTDVDQPIAIAVPDECPAPPLDLPVTADAIDLVRTPDFISYRTTMAMDDVVAFYEDELPVLGWTADAAATTVEDTTSQTFTLDGLHLTITVDLADEATVVRAFVAPPNATE